MTIHNKKCHNLERLAVDNARLVDVEWRQDGEARYPARLLVESVDKPGVLANLSTLVSSENVNISQLQAISTPDQTAQITFIVEVRDKKTACSHNTEDSVNGRRIKGEALSVIGVGRYCVMDNFYAISLWTL